MESIRIKIKKLYDDSRMPTQGSEWAAGGDLYAYIPGRDFIEIAPHETVMIGTGICASIPRAFWGGVFARSGLASKNGLAPANKVGIVDPDYRGEIKVALHNHSEDTQIIHHGDRVAQLVIVPAPRVIYDAVDELDQTDRGDGGFGHTGV